ncbi:unnamed protein product [Menidia menidia]|uniref:Na(+)/H(+) exchange regulatory cofactor NHE-RF1 n=1 Tax=Menidia menidia TaxID=238744 RepID=A0A8S4AT78_9TELE|nr:unnamed protein product [Menidia menidia]
MTIQLELFLPSQKQDWTGRGKGRRSEVNAQLLLSFVEPKLGRGPHRNGPFPQSPHLPLHKSPSNLSQQSANHITPRPLSFLASVWSHHEAASICMFTLGFILMVNDSQELSVIFVPLVLPEQTPMVEEVCAELRPRLCVIQRGSDGYGFNLHSERSRPGQYIRAVDEDSPAERAGLQPKDRIVQVNNMQVEGKTHSEVVAAIRAGGHETRLLVVDPDTDAFFKRCRVVPTLEHLTGPLPEPVINGGVDEKMNGKVAKEGQRDSKLSVSPSPSNASSNTSLTTPIASTPPEGLITDTIPALSLSLQQVKELAHQKRSNKRAPPMDWTKKNELFSNL